MQTTLIIIKPDAVQRGLVGNIISRFERKGLQIAGGRFICIDPALAARHYRVHEGKPFYEGLIRFMTTGPVFVLAIRGPEAVGVCRKLIGTTSGLDAEPGTIRGDLGLSLRMNLIHGSDSPESATEELQLFFDPEQLVESSQAIEPWLFDAPG